MVLRVVRTPSLADQVFEQLASEILSGRHAPGATLPAERKLVERFSVNRHVVREALKRLEQIGVIKITQGGGTRVLDFMQHAGLDLLALMAEYSHARPESLQVWLAVHEMRVVIAADAARLCALRGSEDLKRELLAMSAKMRELGDHPELHTLDIQFWNRVLAGAGNVAYRLAFNSLIKGAYSPAVNDLARMWAISDVKQSEYREPIAAAIAAHDADLAETRTRQSMRLAVDALARVVQFMPMPPAVEEKPSEPPAAPRRRTTRESKPAE
jgi:DNA-binding FadR family transcriptional regulator